MDSLLPHLAHVGTLFLGGSVVVVTYLLRFTVEKLFPDLKKLADANAPFSSYKTTISRYWNEVLLYAIPPALGAGLASLNLPTEIIPGQLDVKMISGLLVGGAFSFLFKLSKKRWDRPSPAITSGNDAPAAPVPPVPQTASGEPKVEKIEE